MNSFRHTHPKRRSSVPKYSHYRKYKPLLKQDFHSRCGYCDDGDIYAGGWRVFHVDHFVPKKHLKTIRPTDYTNLVYSCPYCNGKKLADWPTKQEHVHNDGIIGYIDPCQDEYCRNFARDINGGIIGVTRLGKYMCRSLNLFLRRHAIIWNLQRLDELIKELNRIQPGASKKAISRLTADYYKYIKDLHEANDE